MKIVELDCILLTAPHRAPDRLRSYGVVVVKTEDGRIGVGEPYAAVNMPTVCRESVRLLRELFVGQDAAR
jgi:L-alanine-DL-glutamate epimerase-like enolase superfamily enzyme